MPHFSDDDREIGRRETKNGKLSHLLFRSTKIKLERMEESLVTQELSENGTKEFIP